MAEMKKKYKRKQDNFLSIKRQFMEISPSLKPDLFSLINTLTRSYTNLLYGIITSEKIISEALASDAKEVKEGTLKDWMNEINSIFKFHTRKIGRYLEDLKYSAKPLKEEKKIKIENISNDIVQLNIEEFSCFPDCSGSELNSKLEDMFLDVVEILRISQIEENRENPNGVVGKLGIMNINISPKVFESKEEKKKRKSLIPNLLRPPKAKKRKSLSNSSKKLSKKRTKNEKDKENISVIPNLEKINLLETGKKKEVQIEEKNVLDTLLTKVQTIKTKNENFVKDEIQTEEGKIDLAESVISDITSFAAESKTLESETNNIKSETEYTLKSKKELSEASRNLQNIEKSLNFETPFSFLRSPNVVKMNINRPLSSLKSKSFSDSDASNNFSNFSVKYLKVPEIGGRKRIAISNNGKYLYYGGEGGLAVMKKFGKKRDQFKLHKIEKSKKKILIFIKEIKYFGIKATPSSHLIIQEVFTNNLVIYDKELNEKMKFPSKTQDQVSQSSMKPNFKQPHFSFEGDKMIWFGGKVSLFVVDLRTLTQIFIDKIIPDVSNSPPEPINVIADFEKHRILIHYKVENEDVLVFNEIDKNPVVHLVEDLFPNFNEFECMDITKNKKYGFVGGAKTTLDHVKIELKSKPCLIAFEFEENLKKISEFHFDEVECSTVLCVRLKSKNDIELREEFGNDDLKTADVLILLTDGPLFIVQFHQEDKNFELLRSINIVGVDGINTAFRDMCLHNEKVYLVSDEEHENHILQIKFKPKKNRFKMLPTTKKSKKQSQKISAFNN